MHLISLWAVGLAIVLGSNAHVARNIGGNLQARDDLEKSDILGWFKRIVKRNRKQTCVEDEYYDFLNNSSFGQAFCQAYLNYPNTTSTVDYTPTVTDINIVTTIYRTKNTVIRVTPLSTALVTVTDNAVPSPPPTTALLPRKMSTPQIKQVFQEFRHAHPAAFQPGVGAGESSMSAAFSSACGCQTYGGPIITVTYTDQPSTFTQLAFEEFTTTVASTKTLGTIVTTLTVHVPAATTVLSSSPTSLSDNTTCLETSTSITSLQPPSLSLSTTSLPSTFPNITLLPPTSTVVVPTSPSPIVSTITPLTTITVSPVPSVSGNTTLTLTSTEITTLTSTFPSRSSSNLPRSRESFSSDESSTSSSVTVSFISLPVDTATPSSSGLLPPLLTGSSSSSISVPKISTSVVTVISSGLTSIPSPLSSSLPLPPVNVSSSQTDVTLPTTSLTGPTITLPGNTTTISITAPSTSLPPYPTIGSTSSPVISPILLSSSNYGSEPHRSEISLPTSSFPTITLPLPPNTTSQPSNSLPTLPPNGTIIVSSVASSVPTIIVPTTSIPFPTSSLTTPPFNTSVVVSPVASSLPSNSLPTPLPNSTITISSISSSFPSSYLPPTTSVPGNTTLTPPPFPSSSLPTTFPIGTGSGGIVTGTPSPPVSIPHSSSRDNRSGFPDSSLSTSLPLILSTGFPSVASSGFPTGPIRNVTSAPFPVTGTTVSSSLALTPTLCEPAVTSVVTVTQSAVTITQFGTMTATSTLISTEVETTTVYVPTVTTSVIVVTTLGPGTTVVSTVTAPCPGQTSTRVAPHYGPPA